MLFSIFKIDNFLMILFALKFNKVFCFGITKFHAKNLIFILIFILILIFKI